MSAFKKALLYAGLEKEEIRELMPEARHENGRFVRIYALITAVVFILCLLASLIAGGQLEMNKPIYLSMIVISVVIYVNTKVTMKKHTKLSTLLAILYILSMYGYSFAVSLMHSDMQGTAAVAILVVMPCIFIYRPIYMIGLTVAMGALYCLLSMQIKTHSIAMLDVWNSLFFGAIAVLLSVYQMRVTFQEMLQKRRNRLLSETDLLTGVKNRNCFENNREYYPRLCKENVHCIYVDVNGLHELNDGQGHEMGDKMLQTVAGVLSERFSHENVYRIGGDEFVALCTDMSPDEIRSRIAETIREINEKGYSVSVGGAMQEKNELNMHDLLKEAEAYMYKDKRKYYEQFGHDRRRRASDVPPIKAPEQAGS